ncbi:hypothetical protein CRUP_033502 [Coryphaenoides rupestris]|nr:hypothetical protein CRUP_033502 [Coryphaenoides rupestris]
MDSPRLGVVRESMLANPRLFRGVKSGLVTAKELNQYRAQWASRNHQHNPAHNHSRQTNRTSGVPDITFGITTRPPSPLSDLLAHQYGQRWLDEKQKRPTAPPDQVGSALDTFRDPESRLRAFRAHRSDCVSRRGTFGQGTYNLD